MVVPVVMIGHIVGLLLGLHALEVALAVVPEMVIGVCDISGGLGVQSAVALYLVCVRASVAIEEITVMHPDMVVALLQAAVIALAAVAVHKADVAHFHVGTVLHDQTKAVEHGVRADTLDGDASLGGVDHQITLGHICRVRDIADKAQAQRTLLLVLLVCRDDVLHAGHICRTLAGGVDAGSHSVLVGIGDVYHDSIRFQRAVLVVCAGRSTVYKAKTASVMRLYVQLRGLRRLGGIFLAADHRHDLHGIAAGFQTHSVCPETIRILAHQHGVQLGIAAACGLDIDVIARCTGDSAPFCIRRLQVAAGCEN